MGFGFHLYGGTGVGQISNRAYEMLTTYLINGVLPRYPAEKLRDAYLRHKRESMLLCRSIS